jgi:hypothetical protein
MQDSLETLAMEMGLLVAAGFECYTTCDYPRNSMA